MIIINKQLKSINFVLIIKSNIYIIILCFTIVYVLQLNKQQYIYIYIKNKFNSYLI